MEIRGYELKCSHCGGTTFEYQSAQLNTPGMSFFGLDWLNKSADLYLCRSCGHIEWFLDSHLSDKSSKPARDCPTCGYSVPENSGYCPNCKTNVG